MTLKKYLFCMAVATLFSWYAWGLIVWGVAPEEAGKPGIFFFYLTLFLALFGIIFLTSFLLRGKVLFLNEVPARQVQKLFWYSLGSATALVALIWARAQNLVSTLVLFSGLLVWVISIITVIRRGRSSILRSYAR